MRYSLESARPRVTLSSWTSYIHRTWLASGAALILDILSRVHMPPGYYWKMDWEWTGCLSCLDWLLIFLARWPSLIVNLDIWAGSWLAWWLLGLVDWLFVYDTLFLVDLAILSSSPGYGGSIRVYRNLRTSVLLG